MSRTACVQAPTNVEERAFYDSLIAETKLMSNLAISRHDTPKKISKHDKTPNQSSKRRPEKSTKLYNSNNVFEIDGKRYDAEGKLIS